LRDIQKRPQWPLLRKWMRLCSTDRWRRQVLWRTSAARTSATIWSDLHAARSTSVDATWKWWTPSNLAQWSRYASASSSSAIAVGTAPPSTLSPYSAKFTTPVICIRIMYRLYSRNTLLHMYTSCPKKTQPTLAQWTNFDNFGGELQNTIVINIIRMINFRQIFIFFWLATEITQHITCFLQ